MCTEVAGMDKLVGKINAGEQATGGSDWALALSWRTEGWATCPPPVPSPPSLPLPWSLPPLLCPLAQSAGCLS